MIKIYTPSYSTSMPEFIYHRQFTQIYLSIRSYHKYIMLITSNYISYGVEILAYVWEGKRWRERRLEEGKVNGMY